MMDLSDSSIHPSAKKGGKWFPALCSVCGTLILVIVIAAFLPLTVPKLLGYEIYEVVSGSMEPEIPMGSLLYVEGTKPEEIVPGDVIAFARDNSIITHRVEENRYVEGELITKGDANEKKDMLPVAYENLIGKAVCHIPVLGLLMSMISSTTGKIYAAAFAACGVMFHMLASVLRERQKEQRKG